MPRRPRTPCKQNGCPNLVTYGNKYCNDHKTNHALDAKTTKAKGYNSRWNKARIRYLKLNPLCVYCQRNGRLRKATVVDHITPHRGDQELFGINPSGKLFVNLVMIERPRQRTYMWNILIGFNIVVTF